MADSDSVQKFITRWSASRAGEHAVYAQFFVEFCDLLEVPRPDPGVDSSPDYRFEKPVVIVDIDGTPTNRRIDFYKKDCFVIEAKQGSNAGDPIVGSARRGTKTWDNMMRAAFVQAKRYAVNLPLPLPPFLITCDIGYVFEVWDGFSGDYGDYPARRTIHLKDLADPTTLDFFRAVLTDPATLNPTLRAARVTREVAGHLAGLARALEADGHPPEATAQFLMRCLFTMFAEDVGLLPPDLFTGAIRERWLSEPSRFTYEVVHLWKAMDQGLPFGFVDKLLKFNGGLFAFTDAIPLTVAQLGLLLEAAKCDWSSVEPAIFGTLVERALDPIERHKLGAHFTPREYIERLVRPTVIEPLRAEWQVAQTEVRQILDRGDEEPTEADRKKAIRVLKDFHARLCGTRVLDPACGSGNFLYVTLDLFKELESEVLREMADLGERQGLLEYATVNPSQFLGIERNPRAREIADLVLWIGYLQWNRRTRGDSRPQEPILQTYRNIACDDAILAFDREELRRDERGVPVRAWDGRSFKKHAVTGLDVPDENQQATVTEYRNPRPALWPDADYVVSNPPFVGCRLMRADLGDGYVDALWKAYPEVDRTADLVMYWWHKAALLARVGKLKRFGFITTNSIRQTFNRGVIDAQFKAKDPVALAWAIPDHPWVDGGADVRIAMTVGARADLLSKSEKPVLARVAFEADEDSGNLGARKVEIVSRSVARIHADLSGGADVAGTLPLKANQWLSFQGMNLVGQGFRVARDEVKTLGFEPEALPPVIRPYMNARELAQASEGRFVIDLYGLTAEEARDRYPSLFQWLLERVKPERDQNRRDAYRNNWWVFGEARGKLRGASAGLTRCIITPETARRRFFVFAPTELLPDHKLYVICTDDAYVLGVLSSRIAVAFILATGGRMGVGNDPIFNNTKCFEPYPFPDASDAGKARIRALAEKLDAHRKAVQAVQAEATLSAMYGALDRLRDAERGGMPLTEKECGFHQRALIGVLRSLHDELDAAVFDAYGWPSCLADDEILERLVALNSERAEEELQGLVRWLRPEFQKGRVAVPAGPSQQALDMEDAAVVTAIRSTAWPKAVQEQIRVVRDLLAAASAAMSSAAVVAAFVGASPTAVRRHLEVLESLGFVMAAGDGKDRKWRIAALPGASVVNQAEPEPIAAP